MHCMLHSWKWGVKIKEWVLVDSHEISVEGHLGNQGVSGRASRSEAELDQAILACCWHCHRWSPVPAFPTVAALPCFPFHRTGLPVLVF